MTTPLTALRPAAVLWDMDGTLIDTEPYWMAAETAMVRSFGGSWDPAEGGELVGLGLEDSARILQGAGVQLESADIIRRLTDAVVASLNEHGWPWRPGAAELIAELHAAGIPQALVTMSHEPIPGMLHEHLGELGFAAVVSGDRVTNAKPHPEPYLRAAEMLGVAIENCVAFEDSNTGLTSAAASGALAVALPHLVELRVPDNAVLWDSLAGRGLDDIVQLWSAERGGVA